MEPSNHQRSVILAVDDDDDDIDLMRLLFRKAAVTHPVEVYRQGEDLIEALTVLVKKPGHDIPLLCFLDVKMPTINGHELLRWIREKPQLDRLAIVMLSSSEHPEDVKQAAEGGAQCYLAKYPHPTVLTRLLEEAERVSNSGANVSKEWFSLPANLLLRWGLSRGKAPPTVA